MKELEYRSSEFKSVKEAVLVGNGLLSGTELQYFKWRNTCRNKSWLRHFWFLDFPPTLTLISVLTQPLFKVKSTQIIRRTTSQTDWLHLGETTTSNRSGHSQNKIFFKVQNSEAWLVDNNFPLQPWIHAMRPFTWCRILDLLGSVKFPSKA